MGFLKDTAGATAIEYGLVAALVSVIAITTLSRCTNSDSENADTTNQSSERVVTINQTDSQVEFVIARRDKNTNPFLMYGGLSVDPGSSLSFKHEQEMWIYFLLPSSAMAIHLQSEANENSFGKVELLQREKAESKRFCVNEINMNNVLASESCAMLDSEIVDFYSIKKGSRVFIVNR